MAFLNRSPRLSWFLLGGFVVVLLGFMGWALYATRSFGSMTGGSHFLLVMIAVGVIFTGALTGVLMWLAFYSDRMGYDDRVTYDTEDPRP